MSFGCRQFALVILLAAAGAGLSPLAAQDTPDDPAAAEAQLRDVREQIGALERTIEQQVTRRGSAEAALRDAENGAARVRRSLEEIGTSLAATQARIAALEAEADSARTALTMHVGDFERELATAYIAGRDDWLRSVLSQRDPAAIGRRLVYYRYLATERSEVIDAMRYELERLGETRAALDNERQQLEQTRAAETAHLDELTALRADRKRAVAQLSENIASGNAQVERLRQQAEDLEALIAELTKIIENLPVSNATPFEVRKGQMERPVPGPVVRRFGQSRADGRLRWDGILVGAPAGTPVHAVHYGRVVYADWLPGMGLLVILEHGDGYMSLYGHNQDVAAEVGEWVEPGSVIAHVGDSGGQTLTGLYFEIRKDGAPQDPAPWLAR